MTNSHIQSHNNKKRLAIYFPCFMGGGAEAVALWMLEALKPKYDLTLYTFADLDFEQLNVMYDTNLSSSSIKVNSMFPGISRQFLYFLFSNNKSFRPFVFHSLLHKLKQEVSQYDLAISAYNAVDLGGKGIQYIHWVKVVEGGKNAKIFNQLSNFSLDNLKKNLSLANSYVVADAVEETYGIKAKVIYPPVVINVSSIPWENKENAFICSGRLVKAKEPHKVIQILQQVREKGFDIKLYLTGGGNGVVEWQYKNFLSKIIKENSSWVKLCENLSYQEYIKLLKTCKYGIHYKQEPFGISVAEMVKAGAIPFVKNQGGQVEIVGQDNHELLFANEKDAVEKIIKVLSDSNQTQTILNSLEKQKKLFSTEKFMQEIANYIDNYFD